MDSSSDASDSDSTENVEIHPSSDLKSSQVYAARVECCRCWRLGIPPTWLVLCGAIMVQLGYGFYSVVVKKLATEEAANPYIFGVYRIVGSVPVLILCMFVAERKVPIPGLKMALVFMVIGLIHIFISQIAYVAAVYKLGPSISSALQAIVPVWTTILAVATCTEKLSSPKMLHTWTKLLGIILVSGGAIELGLTGNVGSEDTNTNKVGDQLLGYFFIFLNTSTTAISIVVQKRFIFDKRDCVWRERPVAISAYSSLFGAVFTIPVCIYFIATGKTEAFKIPLKTIFALEYAVFVNTTLSYMLLFWVVLHLTATVVAAFWPLQVLIAAVASYFIIGEKLARWQYAGIVILLIGITLVIFSNYMVERAAKGHKVVRLGSCRMHSCLKTYATPVAMDVEHETELSGTSESQSPLSDPVGESVELRNITDVDCATAGSSDGAAVVMSPIPLAAADQHCSLTEWELSSETSL